jgi:hypothetical protein
MKVYYLQIQVLYPKACIDVEVSNGEDDVPKTDASAEKKKVSTNNDVEGGGVSSAEPITPNLIGPNAPEQTDSSVIDRVASIVPPAGGRWRKRPPPAIRWNKPLSSAD